MCVNNIMEQLVEMKLIELDQEISRNNANVSHMTSHMMVMPHSTVAIYFIILFYSSASIFFVMLRYWTLVPVHLAGPSSWRRHGQCSRSLIFL